jgi:hypothetical protein
MQLRQNYIKICAGFPSWKRIVAAALGQDLLDIERIACENNGETLYRLVLFV